MAKGNRGGKGGGKISGLSEREKLNYEVVSDMLKSREYSYNKRNLKSMKTAAAALNRDFDYNDFGKDKLYGEGGKIAIDRYTKQLTSDFNRESVSIQKAVSKYEKSKNTTERAKYDETKSKLDSARRKKAFFSQFK